MEQKKILKLVIFSIVSATLTRYIAICLIGENMKIMQNHFHKNLIDITVYQHKVAKSFYLDLLIVFVIPYILAIIFYFLFKINLKPKHNFLWFILLFSLLFYLSYFLIGYCCRFTLIFFDHK